KVGNHFIKQFARAGARHGGERINFAQSEAVEHTGFLVQKRMVYLVNHHKNGLPTTAEHVGDCVIQIRYTGSNIHHEQDHRCLFNGDQHLFTDGGFKDIV